MHFSNPNSHLPRPEQRLRYQQIDTQMNDWMARAMDGCPVAYRHFLGELVPLLEAYFRKRLYDYRDEIDDLVQETVLAIHHRRHTYCRELPVMVWVYAIARHKIIDCLRQRGARMGMVPIDEVQDQDLGQTDDIGQHQAWSDLKCLLKQLPHPQGQLIVHTKLDGYSVQETARMMGMSESAVKTAVHRGLKALQTLLN